MGQKYGVRANPSQGGLARITTHNLPKLVSNHGDRKVEALPNGLGLYMGGTVLTTLHPAGPHPPHF